MSKSKITPLGWKILERLAENQMTRKEFCKMHRIPESRLSNIITGLRPAKRYRDQVIALLDLEQETTKR